MRADEGDTVVLQRRGRRGVGAKALPLEDEVGDATDQFFDRRIDGVELRRGSGRQWSRAHRLSLYRLHQGLVKGR